MSEDIYIIDHLIKVLEMTLSFVIAIFAIRLADCIGFLIYNCFTKETTDSTYELNIRSHCSIPGTPLVSPLDSPRSWLYTN